MAVALGCVCGAGAQSLQPISLISFPGVANWPIWIAQEKGFFRQQSIEVALTATPNSVFQITSLIDRKFDLGTTAFDNIVAYVEGQGEVPVAGQPDLFAFMGSTPNMLCLAVAPDVKSHAGLKGKLLSVDATTTGYAFVLFDLLKRQGVLPGDYRIESAGGTTARWEGLREGRYAGTMLTSPFDLIARAKGFNILAYAADAYGHYQGSAHVTRRAWAAANHERLTAYIKGYIAAVEWLRDQANKTEAIAILQKNLSLPSPEMAASVHAFLTGVRGFAPKAQLDLEGSRKVLELRNEYGQSRQQLSEPMRYYDPIYYEAAIR
jgi:ABC-type nitrate/sulfonate/bicarbonate transport system substrate-binding protein